jgi:hypothetical protein
MAVFCEHDMNIPVTQNDRMSCLAEELLASQKGLCAMEF